MSVLAVLEERLQLFGSTPKGFRRESAEGFLQGCQGRGGDLGPPHPHHEVVSRDTYLWTLEVYYRYMSKLIYPSTP